MISALEGILRSRGGDWVVVDVGGVSFRLQVPASTLGILGDIGGRVYLNTHLQAREDGIALYGFASTEELDIFERLIGVAGIGPKVALALLSSLTPEKLAQAIASESVDLLSAIPGVGKKMAARLILELKGKLEKGIAPLPQHADVTMALISLGYSASEAASAITAIPDSPDLALEEKIRLALRHFATG